MIERLLRTLREIPLLPSCLYTLQIDFPLREDSVEFKGKRDFKGKSDKEPQSQGVKCFKCRDGNEAGRDRRMGSSSLPSTVLFCPIPAPYDGENFLTPSQLLRAPQGPVPPRKTLLFVNLSYN